MKRKSFIFLCFIIVLIILLMGCSNKGNGPATNYTLNITIEGEGDVNLDPDRSSYSEGTAVDITAIPATGHVFDHWEGSGFYGETNQNINIVMDSNYSLKAVFVSEGNTVISFADPNLEDVIRNKIDKPTGEIYESDVDEIIRLNLYGSSIIIIYNLSGIENLINLEYLDLWCNKVSDISPLSNLTNLTTLSFEYNQVSDISPLSNLTNLIDLGFGNNQVSDISPLSNLTNLTTLSFGNNQVSDISPLSNLTNLIDLGFGNNQVSDISPLSN